MLLRVKAIANYKTAILSGVDYGEDDLDYKFIILFFPEPINRLLGKLYKFTNNGGIN
ncbi:hypothetical protein [Fortiea sp. LEGE XX443]|nr:hypothetical protein [Fortiea sp. LEGE XX443]